MEHLKLAGHGQQMAPPKAGHPLRVPTFQIIIILVSLSLLSMTLTSALEGHKAIAKARAHLLGS